MGSSLYSNSVSCYGSLRDYVMPRPRICRPRLAPRLESPTKSKESQDPEPGIPQAYGRPEDHEVQIIGS